MTAEDGPRVLKTTATSIAILEHLEEVTKARVSEISESMDLPKSTVHGHLATLAHEQFVVKEGDFYALGPELLRLGSKVQTRDEGYVLAREFTEQLFDETGLRSIFAAEMGGRAAFLHTASGDKMGWAHEQLGNCLYLHDTAVGKAILAALPDQRVKQIVARWGLPAETESTITTETALFDELNRVRERGYAVNRGENFKDLYAIGDAAIRRRGDVIGGFSVTGPAHAVVESGREEELAEQVMAVVREFELELSLS